MESAEKAKGNWLSVEGNVVINQKTVCNLAFSDGLPTYLHTQLVYGRYAAFNLIACDYTEV